MGVKISELNEASSVQNSDLLPIVQNGETKKIQVETLGSQKVNKSGDTLTGELNFNNKNDYAAFRKTRTIDNADYSVSVGVGANGSARLEYYSGTNTLGSVEARNNGIYNGVSGKKLAEQSTGWTNVSLTSYLRGTAWYVKIGNIVIVNFNEVNINQNITQHATVLATGLPKASTGELSLLTNFDTGEYLRILITDTGNIQNHWSNANASNNVWYGTLIYITNE
jgi:hypothetical protein